MLQDVIISCCLHSHPWFHAEPTTSNALNAAVLIDRDPPTLLKMPTKIKSPNGRVGVDSSDLHPLKLVYEDTIKIWADSIKLLIQLAGIRSMLGAEMEKTPRETAKTPRETAVRIRGNLEARTIMLATIRNEELRRLAVMALGAPDVFSDVRQICIDVDKERQNRCN